MAIKVKVLNKKIITNQHQNNQAKILTPKYVRELNKEIAQRIIESENANHQACQTLSLKRRIYR